MARDKTEGGRIPSDDSLIEDARSRGEEAGKAAASWAFADNQGDAYYRLLRRLHDDGDPRFDEYISEPGWLSGEHAGESISELLGDILDEATDYGYDIEQDILDAYEEGASDEFWSEVHRVIELHAGGSPVDDDDDDDDDFDEDAYDEASDERSFGDPHLDDDE